VTIAFGSAQNQALSSVTIQRSDDHGLTFGPYVEVQRDEEPAYFNDKEWVVVDTFKSSPHYGRIYVVWSRFGPQYAPAELRYSDDRGATWSKLIDISAPTDLTEGALPIVQPNGALTVVYDLTLSGKDYEAAQTSKDGGKTWSHAVAFAQFEGTGVPGMRTGGLPSAALDPVTGILYASWQDSRFKRTGYNDIVLSWSTDGGKTWTDPQKVNPDPPSSNITHFTPDVAAYDGTVYVTYGTRASAGGQFVSTANERVSVSPDGGLTFEKERILGPTIQLDWAAQAGGRFLGDYTGVAAWGTEAHAAWTVATKPPFNETYHQTLWGVTLQG
jgi:hypothetical protein